MSNESGIAGVRLSRLDSNGQPVDPGTTGAWMMCTPESAELTFNFDTGDEDIKKDGLGNICLYIKRPDNLKSASLKVTTCGAVAQFLELATNGPGVMLGGETPTGWALSAASCSTGAITERGGVFAEWWAQNYLCSAPDPSAPFIRHWLARWWANYEGGTWDSKGKDYVLSGESVSTVPYPTGALIGGGPFRDITGLTHDTAYLYGEQNETDLPDCTGDYVDTGIGS